MTTNIKLVAVAKDEAPYLADWIAHHLYFGFDEIEVLINRTMDNSESILAKIASSTPNVKWRRIDWIDLIEGNVSRDLQKIAYAHAYDEAKKEFSHLCFMDVDEFWFPTNLRESIAQCVEHFNAADAIYFEWANELGHDTPFQSLSKGHQYQPYNLGKTLFSTSAPLKTISIHRHFFKESATYLLADGTPFISDTINGQAVSKSFPYVKPYFIAHRLARSEEEYISLLYRGNPENHMQFKNNRFGYNTDNRPVVDVIFDDDAWHDYKHATSTQIARWNIDRELHDARQALIEKYHVSVIKINEALESSSNFPTSTLFGLSDRHGILKPDAAHFRGYVDVATPQHLSGWAVNASGEPCKLKVYIDDVLIYETLSTRERKDLLSQGISKGLGGFIVALPPNIKKDAIFSIFLPGGVLLKSGSLG